MIKLKNVHKHFKDLHIINDVSLEVGQGEVVVVCGFSDSGKSTLIRTVNQLESVKSGEIWMDDINVVGPKTDLSKVCEEVDFVFQDFNLYPHLTVLESVILSPMKMKKQSLEQAQKKAMELLERVGLAHKKDMLPNQLSGGQQQCVVIAHGLAIEPCMMLFDKPTFALDPKMVGEVLKVMEDLAESGMTMMHATREMGSTRKIADRVTFVDHSRTPEEGLPEEFFIHPKHEHVEQSLQQVMIR